MSITGTYKVIDGEVVKVSDEIPKIGFAASDLCGPVKQPYWEEHLDDKPTFITSRKQKSRLLKEKGLVEKDKQHGGW